MGLASRDMDIRYQNGIQTHFKLLSSNMINDNFQASKEVGVQHSEVQRHERGVKGQLRRLGSGEMGRFHRSTLASTEKY